MLNIRYSLYQQFREVSLVRAMLFIQCSMFTMDYYLYESYLKLIWSTGLHYAA